MKTSKIFGAIALTAALAMGTVPALALDPSYVTTYGTDATTSVGDDTIVKYEGNKKADDGTYKNTATGSTTVFGMTYVPQLNVTIPLEMGVALPAVDGDIIFPQAKYYKIINQGDTAVTVENVKVESVGIFDILDSKHTAITDKDAYQASVKLSMLRSSAPESQRININNANGVGAAGNDLGWIIAGQSDEGVDFKGTVAWANENIANANSNTALQVVRLNYTVSSAVDQHGKPAVAVPSSSSSTTAGA